VGIFSRLLTGGRGFSGEENGKDASVEQDALRLLEEGSAFEQAGQLEEALINYDAAIRLLPELARAHFCRGNVLLEMGEPAAALDAYASTVAYKPDSAAAHYNMGNACLHLGRQEAAVIAYRKAIALKPDFADAEVALANALEARGELEAAASSYRHALEIRPDDVEGCLNLGLLLQRLGQFAAAADIYRRVLQIRPDEVEALNNLGVALKEIGEFDEAVASYRQALLLRPDLVLLHNNLGIVLRSLGQLDRAVESYQRALAIVPDFAEAHNNLGTAQKDLGQLDAALASYRRAIMIAPNYAEAHYNLGLALQESDRLPEALVSYRRALEISPDNVEIVNNFATALKDLGQFDAAMTSFQRALKIAPEHADAHMNLGSLLKDLGRIDEAIVSIGRALEIDPDYAKAGSNLLFIHNYQADQPAEYLFGEARRYGETVARQARPFSSWENIPDAGRCLCVGFVSGDLRDHPVGHFVEGVLTALSSLYADRLVIFAYPTRMGSDEISERIKSSCRGWCPVASLSDEQLAARIRADGIDILIDLSGHTAGNRLPVFAWKPAPVQATWLGYLATTGVGAIDYLIADAWTLPASEEANFTESVWRLPASYVCFTPPVNAAQAGSLPALSNGHVTFGCFNNLSKVNDTVVALWSRVLAAVPGSRLFLKSAQFVEARVRRGMFERFAAFGIAPERLILEGLVPRADYLKPFQRVDIALDPFPYPGITTSVENLWMGVPVLTLSGNSFLSRQGVGLLMNAGLPDWIAGDADEYVALALSHSSDLQRLSSLRAGLRQRVLVSPIFDAPLFARHFEAALRGMWQKWCEQQR
jgi:predicted O-linked N-acetylglucosamine transferase (SPINDLY family)